MSARRVRGSWSLLIASALTLTVTLAGCSGVDNSAADAAGKTDAADTVSHASGLVQPGTVHIGRSTVEEARPVVLRAQQLYAFWNTGDKQWLDRAVDDSFRDRTLPSGRPQGPSGPVFASKQFRTAVPDLKCALDDLYVVGDTFTARLTFTGHFTGTSNGVQGSGQPIDFGAIDIQHVGTDGRIVEDWHLEDNLTFMQQAGLVPAAK